MTAFGPESSEFWSRIAGGRFGYDAVDSKNRRRAADTREQSEDQVLLPEHRRKLVGAARDLPRNFTIAAWMVRKHLDYVSTFSFRATSRNDALDVPLKNLIDRWSKRQNCDVSRRHRLSRMVRLAEARRTLDGDVFFLKLPGGRLQIIEGDRIRNPLGALPSGLSAADFTHGVKLSPEGAAVGFAVHRRKGMNAFEFEALKPADSMIQHAYFERTDQVRGIGPIAPAINSLRDTYEAFDYALAKMKVAQLFGLVFTSQQASDQGYGEFSPNTNEEGETDGYKVDFGKGPAMLQLEPGDDAKFLESNTPGDQFQSFSQAIIAVSLKSLDIPFSFYDESYTNYSGARQARLEYEVSAGIKRQDNQELLGELTDWRIKIAADSGELQVPAGKFLEDYRYVWQPRGISWIDPLKEVQADLAAVGGRLTSRQRVCNDRGEDWWEIVDELADEDEELDARGLKPEPVAMPAKEPSEEKETDDQRKK